MSMHYVRKLCWRLTTATVAAVVVTTVLPQRVHACGVSTHVEVAYRATSWFEDAEHPEYAQLIARHPGAFLAGAPFPDWGYALPRFSDASESAHWDPFLQAAADYVFRTYPRPWAQETEKLVVFLLAASSHSVADITWHGLGVDEGFIDVMAAEDFRGNWDAAHTCADVGGDMVVAYELDQSYMVTPWYVPIQDLVTIYHELGYDSVTPGALRRGNLLLFAAGQAERLAGQLLYPVFAGASPVLGETLQDYFTGGLDEMSATSTRKWRQMIDWIEHGAAARPAGGPEAGSSPRESSLERSGESALDFLAAHGWQVVSRDTARGAWFFLEPSAAPPGAIRQRASVPARAGQGDQGDPEASPDADMTTAVPYAHLGAALAAGDFNRDGFDDLAVGAPGYSPPGRPLIGAVAILPGPVLSVLPDDLLDGTASKTLIGGEDFARFGWALAVLDFNADGTGDLAVGAPSSGGDDLEQTGAVLIYFGHPGTGLSPTPDVVIEGTTRYTRLGHSVATGDVDGDGFADLLIGSPWSSGGGTQRGMAAVYRSNPLRGDRYMTLDDADWLVQGEADWDWFGWHLELVEAGDATPVLLVGAPSVDAGDLPSAGALYGFDMTGLPQAQPSRTPRFKLLGDTGFQQLGLAFAAGDPWGSGETFVAVATPSETTGAGRQTGSVRLVPLQDLGGTLGLGGVVPAATLFGSQGFEHFGWQVAMVRPESGAPDILLVSAPWQGNLNDPEVGALYGWRGHSLPWGETPHAEGSADMALVGQWVAGRFGSAFVCLDHDGDGVLDLAVAAPQASAGARLSGAVVLASAVP